LDHRARITFCRVLLNEVACSGVLSRNDEHSSSLNS
jgi:hypothetical protein